MKSERCRGCEAVTLVLPPNHVFRDLFCSQECYEVDAAAQLLQREYASDIIRESIREAMNSLSKTFAR